jgi:cyclohexadienyl dehydratase
MRDRVGRFLFHLAVAAVVLAGCARHAPDPPPRAEAPLPVLRVATSGDYAPFSSERNGLPVGMDVEVAERLGRDLGMRVELVHIDWPGLAAATQRGDFDIAMGGVTMRADRALVGRYTRPYATVGAVALVRADDAARFASVEALDRAGVRIAVNAGGHLEAVARARFPRAQISAVPDNRAVLPRLLAGTADAAVTDSAEQRVWQRSDLRALGPFSLDHKAYLLPADHDALAAQVDAWIGACEADGWLDGERTRWLGADASMDAAASGRESVAALIRLRLDLMPAVAAAKRAAGLPIEDRAQEARVIERVRGLSANPDRTAAVYEQLIALAKAVEHATPAPDGAIPLSALRDAIGRVDGALVRTLDSAPPSASADWQGTLERVVAGPGVDAEAVRQLSGALANGGR